MRATLRLWTPRMRSRKERKRESYRKMLHERGATSWPDCARTCTVLCVRRSANSPTICWLIELTIQTYKKKFTFGPSGRFCIIQKRCVLLKRIMILIQGTREPCSDCNNQNCRNEKTYSTNQQWMGISVIQHQVLGQEETLFKSTLQNYICNIDQTQQIYKAPTVKA